MNGQQDVVHRYNGILLSHEKEHNWVHSSEAGEPRAYYSMAPHSNTLAWKIPWMEEPGGLQSMGSLRVGQLSDFAFTFHFHALEKEMATHSSVVAWRIPGMGEPGGLLSMGSHRVGHDWSDLAAAAASQKKKNKYSILTHKYAVWKDGIDEPVCREGVETDVENGLVDTVGGEWGRVERAMSGHTHSHA